MRSSSINGLLWSKLLVLVKVLFGVRIVAGSSIWDEQPLSTSSCSFPFLMDDDDEIATKVNVQVSVAGEIVAGNAEAGGAD